MANRRVGGLLNLKCTTATGGVFYLELRGKWKVVPTRTKKEGVAGQSGVCGFKEMPVVPFMEGDVSYDNSLDVRRLDEAVNITATAELANGRNWVGVDGWRADVSEIDTEEGAIGVKFEFMSIDPLN
jgi:hypothetical protein